MAYSHRDCSRTTYVRRGSLQGRAEGAGAPANTPVHAGGPAIETVTESLAAVTHLHSGAR